MPTRRKSKRQRGGLFSFRHKERSLTNARPTREGWSLTKRHIINMSACPNKDVACNMLDTRLDGKINPTWMTCINKRGTKYHIKYVTPTNMFIKSVESIQIPHFNVASSGQQGAIECKLKIENKFVACFALICGEWYAIMRLFGKTLNAGILANTVRNRVYYRLNTQYITIDESTSVLKFAPDAIKSSDEKYFFSLKKTPILNLDAKVWEHVDRSHNTEVFRVLNTFRIQKIVARALKYEALGDALSLLD